MCPPAAPGVRREDFPAAARPGLRTAVPAFVGHATAGPVDAPVEVARAADFAARFGGSPPGGFLAAAVHAFFRNGGESCVVVRVAEAGEGEPAREALRRALAALRPHEGVDLVCAPDALRALAALLAGAEAVTKQQLDQARFAGVALQREVVAHCDAAGDRMAILDAPPGAEPADLHRLYGRRFADEPAVEEGFPPPVTSPNAALYHPWVLDGSAGWVPPCGHVAGVYARSDRLTGVHKAPANEVLHGVLDLRAAVDDPRQGELNPRGINCIRAFPGRGVRVWGARTLGAPPWEYVPVRRVFLTLGRWIARTMPAMAFEPAGPLLWARIGREVAAWLAGLQRRGALAGATPAEGFYVRCDASTNPPEVREAGLVVTEVGLAPVAPNEFVIVRFTHGPGGVSAPVPAA